jgi:hypothetical protein
VTTDAEPTTLTLAQFLADRLDEDEAVARAATGDTWSRSSGASERSRGRVISWGLTAVAATEHGPDATHIARHDPARVLAEVEVKRKQAAKHGDCGKGYGICDDAGRAWTNDDGSYSCSGLFDLAEVYSWHPDYAANVKSWGG